MITAYLIFSSLLFGWLSFAWSARTTKNLVFKLFLIGMTTWGILSLIILNEGAYK